MQGERSPQAQPRQAPKFNGIIQRLHRTRLDYHFRVEACRSWLETINDMQAVLDDYKQRRQHPGRSINGRTPAKAFPEALRKPQHEPKEDKPNKHAA